MIKQKIDDKTFEEACQNLDNLKIMSSAIASSGTTCILSHEELHSCKLLALWRTLQTWSIEEFPNVKFTTFLFKHVRWQCYYQAHIATKYFNTHKSFADYTENIEEKVGECNFSLEDRLAMYEALEDIPDKIMNIIKQRFYNDMTFKEIGKANGYSHETARKHVICAIESVRKLYM